MSAHRIEKKITKVRVVKPGEKEKAEAEAAAAAKAREPVADPRGSNIIRMHEKLERPEELIGSTYKIKTPVSDHAMYVTINDILLNEGTVHELSLIHISEPTRPY